MTNPKPKNIFFEYLQQISFKDVKARDIFDIVVNHLYSHFITEDKQQLINLFVNPDLRQDQLDDFLSTWDIEQHGADTALLLAYVMKEHPHLKFNDYVAPRLAGVKNYFRFKNLERIAEFRKVISNLNKEGIIPLILKGGAMRHLRPDLPRVMNDIDILMPDIKTYETAQVVAKNLGFVLTKAEHSVDLSKTKGKDKENLLDIHWCMDYYIKNRDIITADFFKRASMQQVFNCQCFVPAKEDLLFLILFHFAKNLRSSSCLSGLPYTVFDLHYLIGLGIDWNIVLENIKKTDTGVMILMAVRFLNKMVPSLLDEKIFEKENLKEKFQRVLLRDTFYARYVFDVKYACKQLRLLENLKDWKKFRFYLKNKMQHFVTKRIVKSDKLIALFFKLRRA